MEGARPAGGRGAGSDVAMGESAADVGPSAGCIALSSGEQLFSVLFGVGGGGGEGGLQCKRLVDRAKGAGKPAIGWQLFIGSY